MKISTNGRYALRLLLDLAQQPPTEYVQIKSVATRQGVSNTYLDQNIQLLP